MRYVYSFIVYSYAVGRCLGRTQHSSFASNMAIMELSSNVLYDESLGEI